MLLSPCRNKLFSSIHIQQMCVFQRNYNTPLSPLQPNISIHLPRYIAGRYSPPLRHSTSQLHIYCNPSHPIPQYRLCTLGVLIRRRCVFYCLSRLSHKIAVSCGKVVRPNTCAYDVRRTIYGTQSTLFCVLMNLHLQLDPAHVSVIGFVGTRLSTQRCSAECDILGDWRTNAQRANLFNLPAIARVCLGVPGYALSIANSPVNYRRFACLDCMQFSYRLLLFDIYEVRFRESYRLY